MDVTSATACERWILQNSLPSTARSLRAVQALLEDSTEQERKRALDSVVLAVEHMRFQERKKNASANVESAHNRTLAVEALRHRLQNMAIALGMRFMLTNKTSFNFVGEKFAVDFRLSADSALLLVEEVRIVEHASSAYAVCASLTNSLRAGLYAECQQRIRQIALQFTVVPNGTRNTLFTLEADLKALNWYFEVKMHLERSLNFPADDEEVDRSLSNTYPMVACGVLSSVNGLLPIKSHYFLVNSPHYGRISKYAEIGFAPLTKKASAEKNTPNCVYTVPIVQLRCRKTASGSVEHVDLHINDSESHPPSGAVAVPGTYYIRPSTPVLVFTMLLDYLHTLYQCEAITYPNTNADDVAAIMDDLLATDEEYSRKEHKAERSDEPTRNFLFPCASMADYLHKIHFYDTSEPGKLIDKPPPLAKHLGFYRKLLPSQVHLYSFTTLRARVAAATPSALRENCCLLVYGFRVQRLAHIPHVLNVLRRQQLINTLMLSCVEQHVPSNKSLATQGEFETLLSHVANDAENVHCINILLNSMLSIPTAILDADAAIKGFDIAQATESEAETAIADAAVPYGDSKDDVQKRESKKHEVESLIMGVRFEHPSRRNVLMQMQIYVPSAHPTKSDDNGDYDDEDLCKMMQLHNIHETIRCEVHFTPPCDIYGLPMRMARMSAVGRDVDADVNKRWLGMCSAGDDVGRLSRIATGAMQKTLSVSLVVRTLIVFIRRQVELAFQQLCTPLPAGSTSSAVVDVNSAPKFALPASMPETSDSSVESGKSSVMPANTMLNNEQPPSTGTSGSTSSAKQQRTGGSDNAYAAQSKLQMHSAVISTSVGPAVTVLQPPLAFPGGTGPHSSFSEKTPPLTLKLIPAQPYIPPSSSNNSSENAAGSFTNSSYGGPLRLKLSNLNSGNITTTPSSAAFIDSPHTTMIARKRGRPKKDPVPGGGFDEIGGGGGGGPLVVTSSSGSKKSAGGGAGRKRSIVSLSGESDAGTHVSFSDAAVKSGGESLSSVYSDEAAVAGLSQYESKKKPGRPKKVGFPSKISSSTFAMSLGGESAEETAGEHAESVAKVAAVAKKRRQSLKDDAMFAVATSDAESVPPNAAVRKSSVLPLTNKPIAPSTVPTAAAPSVRPSNSSPILTNALSNFVAAAAGIAKPASMDPPVTSAPSTAAQQVATTPVGSAASVSAPTLKALPKIPKIKILPKTTTTTASTTSATPVSTSATVTPTQLGQPPPLISSTSASPASNVKPIKTKFTPHQQQHNRPPHRPSSAHQQQQGFRQHQHGSPIRLHTFGSGPPSFLSPNKRGPLLPTPPVTVAGTSTAGSAEPRPVSGSSSALASTLLPPAARAFNQGQMLKSTASHQHLYSQQQQRIVPATSASSSVISVDDESPASPPMEERGAVSFLNANGTDTLYQQIALPPPVSSSNKNHPSLRLFGAPVATSATPGAANPSLTSSSGVVGASLGGSMPATSNPTSPDPENDDEDITVVAGNNGGKRDSRHYYYDDTEPSPADYAEKPAQQQKRFFFSPPIRNISTEPALTATKQLPASETVRRGRQLAGILDRLSSTQYNVSTGQQQESGLEQQSKPGTPAIIASSKQHPGTFSAAGSSTKLQQQLQRGLLVPYTYNANDDDSASSSSTTTTEGGSTTEYNKAVSARLLNTFQQAPPPVIPPSSTLVLVNDDDDDADKLMIDDDGETDVAGGNADVVALEAGGRNFASQQNTLTPGANANSGPVTFEQSNSGPPRSRTADNASHVAPVATSTSVSATTISSLAADNDDDLFNVALA